MLHRIVLVLTLLVVVSCTGDDTIIREVETQVFCPTTGEDTYGRRRPVQSELRHLVTTPPT